MSYEKVGWINFHLLRQIIVLIQQHNLYLGKTLVDCVEYSFSADMWSLGVLVLAMVSYYPNEQNQKLHKNFAMAMHQEQMPFIWLTVDMLVGSFFQDINPSFQQLRSRLVKSGGEELKLFLSDHLLTVSAKRRATAASLPKTAEMKKWCLATVEEDSKFLRKYLIDEVDFANHLKLENDCPNYDALETVKQIQTPSRHPHSSNLFRRIFLLNFTGTIHGKRWKSWN